MIREAFLESDLQDGLARRQRDQRAADLEANGYDCRRQTLHRVLDGMPVYIIEAHLPEPEEIPSRRPIKRSTPRRREETAGRRLPEFEVR